MSGMYNSGGDLIVTLDGEVPSVGVQGVAGGVAAAVRLTDTVRTAQGDGIANGAALVIWTPAAGMKPRVLGCAVASSVAGRLAVRVGGTVLVRLRVPANQTVAIWVGANGHLAALADDVVDVLNSTGGVADLDGVAWGTEG